MSDKETLILAAKAAGIEVVGEFGNHLEIKVRSSSGQEYVDEWNSLENDDDCFRLETATGLSPKWNDLGGFVEVTALCREFYHDHNGDKDKARRYASTRAAALRGRE